MNIIRNAWHFVVGLPILFKVIGGIVIATAFFFALHGATAAPIQEVASDVTHVQVASVASLSDSTGPLSVTGNVTSVSKASILAVSSGEIVSLRRSLGDHVVAGEVIGSFENSSQQATVLQAQGAYEGAQAALAKVKGSTAQNSGISSAQATQGAETAAVAANTTLRSVYATLDDSIHTKTDVLFTNARTSNAKFILLVPDDQLVRRIETTRIEIEPVLESVRMFGTEGAGVDIDARITTMISKVRIVEAYLNDLVDATNKAIPAGEISESDIATYRATVGVARSAVTGAIASLTSAKSSYDSASSGATIASNSASGISNDIAASEAGVKSALGALNGAKANLEKTIIRAPISGTIVSLPIKKGDYVTAFSPVAEISNPSALEIETYITASDAKTIAVGGKAVLDGEVNGVVVFVAPAIDPSTGKIQVKIGIPGTQSVFTDGETISVSLSRSIPGAGTSTKKTITIPISATKITPTGPVVFTVSSSTLRAKSITFGAIVGSQVTVREGLTGEMEIVTDARGLSDGQSVVVDSN